jgi:predicted nucleic acid-binding protein
MLAQELVGLIESFPMLSLVPLDRRLTRRAVRIAATYQLRGADSIYVAVAEVRNATLITWDTEMIERGSHSVGVMTPCRRWRIAS